MKILFFILFLLYTMSLWGQHQAPAPLFRDPITDGAAGAFAQTKSVIMCTYFLCGFANFASIGIQIGGIGGLTPKNKPLLAQFGMRALLAGTLASLLSATVVGMIIG